MDNEITSKRGLILILVIATVVVFIGLVWLIATYVTGNSLRGADPSVTPTVRKVFTNCTYPISYWMEHPELYPSQILFGSEVYKANEIREMLTQSDQNPAAKLQAELVGAFLNISSGADQTDIETTIFQAYSWLVQHPAGSETAAGEIDAGLRYFYLLEAYNLGLAGVVACPEGITRITPEITTASVTTTVFITTIPSQTPTLTQTETPSPTGSSTTPISTVIYLSPTATPTTQSPGGLQPTITRTSAPSLTYTPIKTTQAPSPTKTPTRVVSATYTKTPQPSPTFTEPPPPTPTFTLPPMPTPTYTEPPPP